MPARYYDPATYRFLSADPAPPSAGDPGSLNAFVYCGNDPVGGSDPSGARMIEEAEAWSKYYNSTGGNRSLAEAFTHKFHKDMAYRRRMHAREIERIRIRDAVYRLLNPTNGVDLFRELSGGGAPYVPHAEVSTPVDPYSELRQSWGVRTPTDKDLAYDTVGASLGFTSLGLGGLAGAAVVIGGFWISAKCVSLAALYEKGSGTFGNGDPVTRGEFWLSAAMFVSGADMIASAIDVAMMWSET